MSEYEMNNIQVYRKKWNMNIGIVIFGVIFIYLVVTILAYITEKHVSVYEVREGSILKDTAYTGIVLRQETVVTTESDGYINYLVAEGSKIGKKTNVYSLSPNKIEFEAESVPEGEEANTSEALTAEDMSSVFLKIQNFSESYQDNQFDDVYALKEAVFSTLSSNSTKSRQAKLDAMLAGGVEGLSVHTAADDGIITYSVDGYEGLTMDQVTEQTLSKEHYQKKELVNNTQTKAGDPAYKLVTSEDWTLVIQIDDKFAQSMANTKRIKVRFAKDNQTTWADFAIYNTPDTNLAFLTFDHSMVRYAGERFLDIELILEDQSGLKIPKSAVTNKDFYLVPENYLTQDENSKAIGILTEDGQGNKNFQNVTVYYRDMEKGMVYLDPNALKEHTVLVKPDSEETYKLDKTGKLSGVYNINKGYAVFCQIHKLCESEDYFIVESGNDYGLSNYDHIALDSKMIRENDVVF